MHRRDALKTSAVGAMALASLDGNALRTFAEEPATKQVRLRIDKNRYWLITHPEGKTPCYACCNGILKVFVDDEKEKFIPSGGESFLRPSDWAPQWPFMNFVHNPHYSLRIVTTKII